MAVVFAQPIEQYPRHLAFSSTPTMTNVDSAYPASRLLTYDPTMVARTTSTTTTFQWDFGTAREFDVVSLQYTNTSYAATWTIQGSQDASSWTSIKGSDPFWAHRTSVPGSWTGEINDPRRGSLIRNCSWYIASTVQSYRHLRIIVTDPQTANMTFGRLFVGKSFSPATGMQYGSSISFTDTGKSERTDRGALILDYGQSIVSASVKLEFLSATEMYDYVYEFDYWRGSCREVLVCLDTTDTAKLQKNILYATITDGRTVTADAFNLYSKTWTLESIA